jgi:hypothetical protein
LSSRVRAIVVGGRASDVKASLQCLPAVSQERYAVHQ